MEYFYLFQERRKINQKRNKSLCAKIPHLTARNNFIVEVEIEFLRNRMKKEEQNEKNRGKSKETFESVFFQNVLSRSS